MGIYIQYGKVGKRMFFLPVRFGNENSGLMKMSGKKLDLCFGENGDFINRGTVGISSTLLAIVVENVASKRGRKTRNYIIGFRSSTGPLFNNI